MNNRNIENFMALVTNGKGTPEKESRSDRYYRSVYEKINSEKKFCFNWSSMLFGVLWLLYRKMYMCYFTFSIAFYMLGFILGLIVEVYGLYELDLYVCKFNSYVATVIFIYFFSNAFLGFFGNNLYINHIIKKIDKGYFLCSFENIDLLPLFILTVTNLLFRLWNPVFSMVIANFIGGLSMLAIYISEKKNVKKALDVQRKIVSP